MNVCVQCDSSRSFYCDARTTKSHGGRALVDAAFRSKRAHPPTALPRSLGFGVGGRLLLERWSVNGRGYAPSSPVSHRHRNKQQGQPLVIF